MGHMFLIWGNKQKFFCFLRPIKNIISSGKKTNIEGNKVGIFQEMSELLYTEKIYSKVDLLAFSSFFGGGMLSSCQKNDCDKEHVDKGVCKKYTKIHWC